MVQFRALSPYDRGKEEKVAIKKAFRVLMLDLSTLCPGESPLHLLASARH